MPDFAWAELMQAWNADVLADAELRPFIEQAALDAGWLGYPGASEAEIAAAETRLGITLPPSYRAFLAFSNGWRMLNSFIEQLWSADEVERYAVRHADLVESWLKGVATHPRPPVPDAEYFVYGPGQDSITMRDEYLESVIEVSDYADGILLLNPQVVFEDGEWEAWFFAPWKPGADRYRSFWEMMQALR